MIENKLRAAGCVFAEEEAQLLISAARTYAELDDMVEQRIAGLPLSIGFIPQVATDPELDATIVIGTRP